jgi:uncharacterized protein
MSRRHFLDPALDAPRDRVALFVEGRSTPIATQLDLASDSASRTKGLLGRTEYPADAAMIIAPCNAIHTFFMRMTIDVVFAARDGRVVKLRRSMRPWRISAALGAFAVIEFAEGGIDRARMKVGDRLEVRSRTEIHDLNGFAIG